MAAERRRSEDIYYVPRFAFLRRVSWGAVLAGSVMAVATLMALGELLVAVGAGLVDPERPGVLPEGFGVGAGMAWLAAVAISLFVGGVFAGRLAGVPSLVDSALHGFVSWGLASIVVAYLLVSGIGAMAGGATRPSGGAAQAGAPAATAEGAMRASQLALLGFVGMLIGAGAAAGGGAVGMPRDLREERRRRSGHHGAEDFPPV